MTDQFTVTYLYGVKELKPVEYRVTSYIEGPWWWRRTLWAVESEYMKISNIVSEAEAKIFACRLRLGR